MSARFAGAGLVLVALSSLGPGLDAQTTESLADRCATLGGDAGLCGLAAATGRDLLRSLGALAGPGSDLPGQTSTLGRRLGGAPRVAVSLRAAGLGVQAADLADPTGGSEVSPFVSSLHATLGLGVFEGFALLPTVGGFLSLDVVGQGSLLFFSDADGFDGRVRAVSLGARLGLLRESFTLPGVTLSVSRRFTGTLRLGSAVSGDPAEVEVDPSTTSVRLVVAKDLFAFGVLGGVGWDDHSAETTIRFASGGGPALVEGSIEDGHPSYFVGLSRQLGVLAWVAAEVGWFRAGDPLVYGGVASPDGGWSVFGSLSLLLRI
jgi:hypothetical protein